MIASGANRALQCSLIATFILCGHCSGAFEHAITGARPTGLGGAFVALADDPDALFVNPAGLTRLDGNTLCASYSRPFGLRNLSLGALEYVHPTGRVGWGMGLRSFGNGLYQEHIFGLSHGHTIGTGLQLGVTVKVYSLSIERFGSASTCGVDVGGLIQLSKKLHTGCCLHNINSPRLGNSGEQLRRRLHIGLRSNPEENLILVAELQKDTADPLRFRFGQEYRISPFLAIRLGLSTGPTTFTGGAGFYIGRFRFDYAFSSHPVLGMTHQASLTIQFGTLAEKSNTDEDR
jgi:hypothetical protein